MGDEIWVPYRKEDFVRRKGPDCLKKNRKKKKEKGLSIVNSLTKDGLKSHPNTG